MLSHTTCQAKVMKYSCLENVVDLLRSHGDLYYCKANHLYEFHLCKVLLDCHVERVCYNV